MGQWWVEMLRQHAEVAVFLTVGLGSLLGRLRFRSTVLGPVTGTLLAGVLVGQAVIPIDPLIKTTAFTVSLFALGYNVGPQFFAGLRADGLRQLALTVISCVLALIGGIAVAQMLGYGPGWGAGLFAGGLTQSSVIGVASAAIDALPGVTRDQAQAFESQIAVGFAVCYLVSTVAGAYFLSVVAPRLLGVTSLAADAREMERELGIAGHGDVAPAYYSVVRRTYRLKESPFIGLTVDEAERRTRARGNTLILHRLRREDAISVLTPQTVLRVGDVVSVSTRRRDLTAEDPYTFAIEVDDPELLDYEVQRLPIVVTKREVAGATIGALMAEVGPRIFIDQLVRGGVEVPWSAATVLQLGDELHVQGVKEYVEAAAAQIGYPLHTSSTTDLSYLGIGLALGCVVGIPTLGILTAQIGLTTSGGALLVGLVLGYLRARRPTFGHFPPAANWLMSTGGLCLFVGVVGITAAPTFFAGVRQEGLGLVLGGLVVGLFPMVVCLYLGRYLFRFRVPILLGVIAGANTTTAGIGAVTDAAKSQIPVIGYTAPYAAANILLTIWGGVLVAVLS